MVKMYAYNNQIPNMSSEHTLQYRGHSGLEYKDDECNKLDPSDRREIYTVGK